MKILKKYIMIQKGKASCGKVVASTYRILINFSLAKQYMIKLILAQMIMIFSNISHNKLVKHFIIKTEINYL